MQTDVKITLPGESEGSISVPAQPPVVVHPIDALRQMVAYDIARTNRAESFMIRSGLLADLLDELAAHRLSTQSSMQARTEELEAALRDTADMLRRQHLVAPGHASNAEKVNGMLERARVALSNTPGGQTNE